MRMLYIVRSGDWLHNERTGSGSMLYADGSEYAGEWAHNRRHGIQDVILWLFLLLFLSLMQLLLL
jgi:hypothetical protein